MISTLAPGNRWSIFCHCCLAFSRKSYKWSLIWHSCGKLNNAHSTKMVPLNPWNQWMLPLLAIGILQVWLRALKWDYSGLCNCAVLCLVMSNSSQLRGPQPTRLLVSKQNFQLDDLFLKYVYYLVKYKYSKEKKQWLHFHQIMKYFTFISSETAISDQNLVGTNF